MTYQICVSVTKPVLEHNHSVSFGSSSPKSSFSVYLDDTEWKLAAFEAAGDPLNIRQENYEQNIGEQHPILTRAKKTFHKRIGGEERRLLITLRYVVLSCFT